MPASDSPAAEPAEANHSEAGGPESEPPTRVDFNQHIRPVFVSHCLSCHGGVKQQAGISFVYRDQVLPPEGWIVEPGDPGSSIIIDRVIEDDPSLRMPPAEHGPPLSSREIDLLRQWIAEGATWKEHWAFEPPPEPEVPTVKNHAWARSDIDRFVQARREQVGLDAPPDSAPHRWLRRVSLDITGLPPSPEELERFLAELDSLGDGAYGRVVDRLLASPHYGERWASVWLDQVRYADSKGLGLDGPRSIWKYRDWVIRSLNADMPYDQFTIKQIAGDLLPGRDPENLIATACHRLTQTNEEGGTDDEEFRIAAVLDRVNTTWQTWQGMTFGCVQCHDHPYEPFRHEDYYRFAAFFNSTVDTDLGDDAPLFAAPLQTADYKVAEQLDEQIQSLQESLWAKGFGMLEDDGSWTPLQGLSAKTSNATVLDVEEQSAHDEFTTVGTIQHGATFTLEAPLPAGLESLTAIKGVVLPLDPEAAKGDSEWGFVWSHVSAELLLPSQSEAKPLDLVRVIGDEPHPIYDPQMSLDSKSGRGFAALSRIYYPRRVALVLSSPVVIPRGAKLRLTIAHRVQMVGAFSLTSRRGWLAVSGNPDFTDFANSPTIAKQREQLAKLQEQRREIRSTPTPVMQERPTHLARQTNVFERGLFLDKGKQVSAGVPSTMPPLSRNQPADRLAMAEWLASEKNPLTARVAVNRVWAQLFGVGLVETEEDFGSSGEPPSHPGLLDHLALRLQNQHDWRFKPLLRELVLSSTYRQSEVASSTAKTSDPNNRLLSRGPRHRLSSEMVRDQALALSGLLVRDLYGPPVKPPIPDGVWQPFAAYDRWPAAPRGDADRYRRSIYTYTKRSIPYPMFATFDQPSREFCSPRRLRSNTPLQALQTLNSESFDECTEALAERITQTTGTPEEQIAWGFKLVTCRPPKGEELTVLTELLEHPGGGAQAVAKVLLNLDEVLMK
ncbi:PSD1 and planctomycete cytochrome C domain-containing protein [Posidoniimonas corsicana]|uniref:PSD1 and planctomycete cytochrome C domain-containing protein n=1 Tax=Posidoniimonas corsicana TaxID=1938618 RepID=UPI0036F3AA17